MCTVGHCTQGLCDYVVTQEKTFFCCYGKPAVHCVVVCGGAVTVRSLFSECDMQSQYSFADARSVIIMVCFVDDVMGYGAMFFHLAAEPRTVPAYHEVLVCMADMTLQWR